MVMRPELNQQQERIYNFVCAYIRENSYPPTIREICAGVSINSTSTVHIKLKQLSEMGLIKYTPSTRRSIVLCDESQRTARTVHVPVVGDVAAGTPILAVDNIQDYYDLPDSLLHGAEASDVLMLRVKGDSMIEIGMLDGDMIVVDSAANVSNGDIAVARVLGETATVKRFFREDGRIRLQPENCRLSPIYAEFDEVEIVGKVVSLIRNI